MSPSGDIDARQRAPLDFSRVSVSMPGPGLQLKRWKRIEYEQLVDKGVFMPGDRIELIDGLLVVAEPQSSSHYIAIRLVERALARAFGEGWDVRTQAPIALDDTSEPEPDVAIFATTRRPIPPIRSWWWRSPSRASSPTGCTSPASTLAPAVRSTGSSTWSTACSKCIAIPRRRRRRRTDGTTVAWRRWALATW